MGVESIDIVWVILSAGLVFFMQAGFLCLESGLTRTKNNINVAVKNLTDFSISTALFWLFGFGIMFGSTSAGWLGTDAFAPDYSSDVRFGFMLFHIMFCGTAVTILSGAIAERVRFISYMVIAALVSGLVYPIFGHWAWNGMPSDVAAGWLGDMGFVDFAGSTVVHSVGGWSALAIVLVIGPRAGRFNADGSVNRITGGNLPLAALGVILLWFGWFGFNGGSTLAAAGDNADLIIRVLMNTVIAGAFGTLAVLAASWPLYGRAEVHLILNGALSGLVSVTANAHAISLPAAALIGAIGALVMVAVDETMIRFRVDDAVGAIPVHLGAGVWGTLAVGIFGQRDLLGTDLARGEQIVAQGIGIAVAGAWAFGVTYVAVRGINRLLPIRVTLDAEHMGLNVSEHAASNDLQDLFTVLHEQEQTGNLSLRAPVEPFTEVGQIAARYNRVMDALQGAVNRTEAIVRSAMDAIVTFSTDNFTILSLNPAAETIFGHSSASMVGQPVNALFGTDHQDVRQLLVAAALDDRHLEIDGQHADGQTFPMEVALTETPHDRQPFITGVFRDVSERKAHEAELTHAKEQAEAANRSKSTFLANMSHELRTPLNAVIGYGDMILSEVYGPLTGKQKDRMERIVQNGHLLLGHINSILDLSKIEAGRMDLYIETFDVASLLSNVMSTVSPLAAKNHNRLVRGFPETVGTMTSDMIKVQQIMLNLLSNACKFTNDGTITIAVGHETDTDGDFVVIHVTDTGIGMNDEQLARVFEEFAQADVSTTRQYGGTGLGLALVSRFTSLLGGTVAVDSTPGQGSTFSVRLPQKIARAHADHSAATLGLPLVKLNKNLVLVIDDDPNVREMLSHYLDEEGFIVETAATGSEGLERARSLRPGLITLDVMIPHMDGWSVLALLKSDDELAHIPVIMMTIVDDRNVGFTLGAADFVNKPIQRDQLTRAILPFKPATDGGLVLVVEDDDSTRRMIVDMLAEGGWRTIEADNGAVALLMLSEYQPQLVLLDLMMPVMDGFGFLHEKRRQRDETPVIVVTSMDLDADSRHALNGGVERILQKGNYSRDELLNEVRAHIRQMR